MKKEEIQPEEFIKDEKLQEFKHHENSPKGPELDELKKEEVREPELITLDKAEVDALRQSVQEYQDRYLRLLAESENARKRMQKEKSELQAYSRENLICEFLGPIDHFENALSFQEGVAQEVKNWMVGFEMILAQFKEVLSQNEIKPIEALGKTFDPHFHEALEAEESEEYPINTIIKEYVRGYRMGNRVIRPSKVKVTKSLEPKNAQEKNELKETPNQKEG